MKHKFRNPFKEDFNYKWTIPVLCTISSIGTGINAMIRPTGPNIDGAEFLALSSALIWVFYFLIILYPTDSWPEDYDDP